MDVEKIALAVAVVVVFGVGYSLGRYSGKEKLNDYMLQAAVLRAEQGKEAYERLVAAQDALDASRADADGLRADALRLQQSYENRLRRASSTACRDEQAAVARCESLLRESLGLVEEGAVLLRRNAAIHDATVEAVK